MQISVHQNNHYVWLMFDDILQSIMLKRKPEKLPLPHHYFLLLPLLFFTPKKVVEFGLGGGNLFRFLNKLSSEISLLSIEQNQQVINCFEKYFNPENAKTNTLNKGLNQWLSAPLDPAIDWYIYDIYQVNAPEHQSIQQIKKLIETMRNETWLSINLPNLSEQELNQFLQQLTKLKQYRTMKYFLIPYYKNTIVHLFPQSISFSQSRSLLNHNIYQRWQKLWQFGINCR